MERIKTLFARHRSFFLPYFFWLLILTLLVCSFPRLEIFQMINQQHNIFADYMFSILTQFGDGIVVMAIGLLFFLFRKRRLGLAIAITYIGSGLICSLLKRSFLAYRPAHYLADDPSFHSVSWLPLAYHNAFPSGHTTSAFALACTIALFAKNKNWGRIALGLAILCAYSRIYLGQHFADDVWFGSVLGVSISCAYALILQRMEEKRLSLSHIFPPSFKL